MVGSPDDLAELNSLLCLLGDVIDGFESVQVLHPDPFIEAQLGDLRYLRHRLAKLIECLEKLIEQFRAP
jgi:hypothetical protein